MVKAVQMLVPPWAYNSGAIMTMSALPIVIKSEKLFLSNFHRRRYPAKSTIIYAGDKADVLYYLVKGTVSVLAEDGNDGKDMIVTYLNPGEFFGEMGLFEEHPRSAWIKTKTDCEVCEISYSKFTALYQKEPEILFSVAKQIAKRSENDPKSK